MHEIIWLKGNVPLCFERKGRGAMPPRLARRTVASEAEAPLNLWLALRVCRVLDCHQDIPLWGLVPPMFSERGYGFAGWE